MSGAFVCVCVWGEQTKKDPAASAHTHTHTHRCPPNTHQHAALHSTPPATTHTHLSIFRCAMYSSVTLCAARSMPTFSSRITSETLASYQASLTPIGARLARSRVLYFVVVGGGAAGGAGAGGCGWAACARFVVACFVNDQTRRRHHTRTAGHPPFAHARHTPRPQKRERRQGKRQAVVSLSLSLNTLNALT